MEGGENCGGLEAQIRRGWDTHTGKKKKLASSPKFTQCVHYKSVKEAFLHASIMNKGVSRRGGLKPEVGVVVKSERVSVGGKAKRGRGLCGKERKGRRLRFPTVTDGRGRKKETDTLHLTHCLDYLLLCLSFCSSVTSFLLLYELGHYTVPSENSEAPVRG